MHIFRLFRRPVWMRQYGYCYSLHTILLTVHRTGSGLVTCKEEVEEHFGLFTFMYTWKVGAVLIKCHIQIPHLFSTLCRGRNVQKRFNLLCGTELTIIDDCEGSKGPPSQHMEGASCSPWVPLGITDSLSLFSSPSLLASQVSLVESKADKIRNFDQEIGVPWRKIYILTMKSLFSSNSVKFFPTYFFL